MLGLPAHGEVIDNMEGLRIDYVDCVGSAVGHVNSFRKVPDRSAQFSDSGFGVNVVLNASRGHTG